MQIKSKKKAKSHPRDELEEGIVLYQVDNLVSGKSPRLTRLKWLLQIVYKQIWNIW